MPRSNRPRRAGSARTGTGKSGTGKPGTGKPSTGKPGSGKASGTGARNAPAPELDLERARSGFARRESAPDGEWMVRSMTASRAEKTYICPGCSTAVLPGIAHLVVWSEDHLFGAAAGLAERRHWHTNCWTSRTYRYR